MWNTHTMKQESEQNVEKTRMQLVKPHATLAAKVWEVD